MKEGFTLMDKMKRRRETMASNDNKDQKKPRSVGSVVPDRFKSSVGSVTGALTEQFSLNRQKQEINQSQPEYEFVSKVGTTKQNKKRRKPRKKRSKNYGKIKK